MVGPIRADKCQYVDLYSRMTERQHAGYIHIYDLMCTVYVYQKKKI